jgi:hypothetical protein
MSPLALRRFSGVRPVKLLSSPCPDWRLTRPCWASTSYDANGPNSKLSIERFLISGRRSMLSLPLQVTAFASSASAIAPAETSWRFIRDVSMTEPRCILFLVDQCFPFSALNLTCVITVSQVIVKMIRRRRVGGLSEYVQSTKTWGGYT